MDDDVASKHKTAEQKAKRDFQTSTDGHFPSTHPFLRRSRNILFLREERLNGERNRCRTQETRTQQGKATRTLKKNVRGNFRDIQLRPGGWPSQTWTTQCPEYLQENERTDKIVWKAGVGENAIESFKELIECGKILPEIQRIQSKREKGRDT